MAEITSVQSIDLILNAKTIALVGASKNPNKWGYKILDTIIQAGYEGKIVPINPKEKQILGLNVYPSVLDVPFEIDMMILCIPNRFIPEVIKQAIEKKIHGAVVIANGYREVGHPEKEEELLNLIKGTNLRLIGPNIMGTGYIPNKLCVQTMPVITKQGPIGLITQSGSVTGIIAEWAQNEGIGVTGIINLGNQIDLCESDFLEFFAQDDNTKAIAMYLEGPKNGRRFFETLKKVTAIKPVVILKPGRTIAGTTAAKSHTASIGGNDVIFSCMVKQCGGIREVQLDSFYDTVKTLATQPIPNGNRVLMFTTSGGIGSLIVDILSENGVVLADLPLDIINDFKEKLKDDGLQPGNPYDFPVLSGEEFHDSLELMAKHDIKRNLTDLFFFTIADQVPGIEDEIIDFTKIVKKPVIVAYAGGGIFEQKGVPILNAANIPAYHIPSRAARSAAALINYGEMRRKK